MDPTVHSTILQLDYFSLSSNNKEFQWFINNLWTVRHVEDPFLKYPF